jgi:alkylated DNA repair dioxygenase AlkB
MLAARLLCHRRGAAGRWRLVALMTEPGMTAEHRTDTAPPGLMLGQEFVSSRNERELIELIKGYRPEIHSYDPQNPRHSVTFGWNYDFDTQALVREAAMPAVLEPLCQVAADFAGVDRQRIVNCLLQRYDPGAIIQPHVDKSVWDYVIGISLGSATTMEFRRNGKGKPLEVELVPRSIYVLTGEARHVFTHAIPAVERTRYSITFRSFSDEGRQLAHVIDTHIPG